MVSRAQIPAFRLWLGAPRPLPGSLAMGVRQAKLDVDLRTWQALASLPFILFMTITPLLFRTRVSWLLWRLTLLIAWPFWWQFQVSQHGCGGLSLKVMPAWSSLYAGLHMSPSFDFLGMCVVSQCTAFLCFFMARWVSILLAMSCMRVVQLLLPAFLLRGPRMLLQYRQGNI
jgi:hypothetical protein